MQNKREHAAFKKTVRQFYKKHGRHRLPWRNTHDPYRIMVSEIMLQQTQVDRVIPYYERFIQSYPTVQKLAQAPLRDVLTLWQGLGYNRRGKYLHDAAKAVMKEYRGVFPKDQKSLESLPGIGPYTAAAISAFAFNTPSVLIETNVRTVYTHHFFPHQAKVPDAAILAFVEETCDAKNSREWYYALMDYGSHLKKNGVRINAKSAHYVKQSKFKGSNRELRGKILRMAIERKHTSVARVVRHLHIPSAKAKEILLGLKRDGLLKLPE